MMFELYPDKGIRNPSRGQALRIFGPHFVRSFLRQFADAGKLKHLHNYCMFIGYPRSGHSVIGTLLNAHRQVIIAHELHALQFLRMGFGMKQVYSLILKRDRSFIDHGAQWEGYSYTVPDQWQGRFEQIRVIGDKKGGETSWLLGDRPELLQKLRDKLTVPLRAIHQVRNPFDNVATMARRGEISIEKAAKAYFALCDTNQRLRSGELSSDELFEVRHEEMIYNPKAMLRDLCSFIGIDAPQDFIDACANCVHRSPNRSRDKMKWTDEQIESIQKRIDQYDFLSGYSFST